MRAICRFLAVHFSGFYVWLKEPLSQRALEDVRQTELIHKAWTESGKVYGYRKLADDLLDQGEVCSENRVARLASLAGVSAQIGYKRRPGRYGGKPAVVADNTLDRQFEVAAPDTVWVTDISYIRTHEGWPYLAVVIDLFSRRVVGWSPLGTLLCNTLPGSGPRVTVHWQSVAIGSQQTQSGCQHEPPWELV